MEGFKKKKIMGFADMINETYFKPKISSIFHFELVNEGWIIHVLMQDWVFDLGMRGREAYI